MKIYEVFIQDEWNNNYLIGFYKSLDKAVPDVNEFLKSSYNIEITTDDLKEYPSTFETCFDTHLDNIFEDNEDLAGVMIRGFILDDSIFNNLKGD